MRELQIDRFAHRLNLDSRIDCLVAGARQFSRRPRHFKDSVKRTTDLHVAPPLEGATASTLGPRGFSSQKLEQPKFSFMTEHLFGPSRFGFFDKGSRGKAPNASQ
jgi:hypothetical protein